MTAVSFPASWPEASLSVPAELPPRVEIPDDSDPEERAVSPRRREGLWIVADMPDGQLLVVDAPLPGTLQ